MFFVLGISVDMEHLPSYGNPFISLVLFQWNIVMKWGYTQCRQIPEARLSKGNSLGLRPELVPSVAFPLDCNEKICFFAWQLQRCGVAHFLLRNMCSTNHGHARRVCATGFPPGSYIIKVQRHAFGASCEVSVWLMEIAWPVGSPCASRIATLYSRWDRETASNWRAVHVLGV